MVYGMEIPTNDVPSKNLLNDPTSIFGIMDFSIFESISTDTIYTNSSNIISSVFNNMERQNYPNHSADYLEWSNDLKFALNTVKSLSTVDTATTATGQTLNGNLKFDDEMNEENIDSTNIIENGTNRDNYCTTNNSNNGDTKIRTKVTRKRKYDTPINAAVTLAHKKIQYFNNTENNQEHDNDNENRKSPLELAPNDNVTHVSGNTKTEKVTDVQLSDNTSPRITPWQVNDITDNLATELDGSLSDLGGDLTNGSYNMSDTLLQLPSLQVFKQEAPSPPNNDNVPSNTLNNISSNGGQIQQHMQQKSPESPSSHNVNQNSGRTDSNNNQNNVNASLQHLLNSYGNNIANNSATAAVGGGGTGTVSTTNLIQQQNQPEPYCNHNSVSQCNSDYTGNNGFQYVLAAATSIATKINEDTLTYLNQGQSYEIKLKKLGDLSSFKGKTLKSVIGICFHERRMQYGGRERLTQWQNGRPGDRVLEVDVPLSYGLTSLEQPSLNTVSFNWDPTIPVGVYIKVNCISTEFTEKKHGGERGIPLRIQVETYDTSKPGDQNGLGKRLHAGACQIKVFKLKGADRKHKQDREKIMKRPLSEQEKYQPSYDCTVLNDISYDDIIPTLGDEPMLSVQPPLASQNGSRNNYMANLLSPPSYIKGEEPVNATTTNLAVPQSCTNSPGIIHENNKSQGSTSRSNLIFNLSSTSTVEETMTWLTNNNFNAYLNTFASFSGADMLRLSRDDFIQICGLADGIRLYNALHAKTIVPKLTLYICTERSNAFNAIYLNSYTNEEFGNKLSTLIQMTQDQIQGYFIQGPNGIHIHINDEVIRHFKNETMYTVEIIPDLNSNTYRVLLKSLNS